MRDLSGDIQGHTVPVEGGGTCIYCGWHGGAAGLRDEHIMPYALGGNTVLQAASCAACEKVTSYLDGYLANATYKHARVHTGVQSRRGHPKRLPALVLVEGETRHLELEPQKHPYFLHMPVWRPPGLMLGLPPSPDFGEAKAHVYWYVPPDIRALLGLRPGQDAEICDTTPMPNLATFARAIAKVAYCHAVYIYGLGGFRSLMLADVILGRCPNIPYVVGSELGPPAPPGPASTLHLIQRTNLTYKRWSLITVRVRLFAHSGTEKNGMPTYEVVVGAEGRTTSRPRPAPELPKVITVGTGKGE